MPAPPPAFYPVNLLDGAALGMTPDGAVSGKGPDRLIDRDLGLECEDGGVSGARVWMADRGVGAAPDAAAAWILAGSNLAGVAFTLDTSDDGSTWTPRATMTPAANTPVRAALAPFPVPRYVRWTATDPPTPVRLTEVVLAPALTFRWKPAAGSLTEPQVLNVNLVNSVSGRGWAVQRGPRRWSSTFTMTNAPNVDRIQMLTLLDDLADTAKPFFVLTVTGELRWVRLLPPITAAGVTLSPSGEWNLPVSLVEELP